MSGIVPPGPELQPKIHLVAAKLSKLQKNSADEFVKKLLNSPRAPEVFFADPNDMFYPYFLQQLTMFRNDSSLAEATIAAALKEKEGTTAASGQQATAAKAAASTPTPIAPTVTTSTTGSIIKSGGTMQEALLRSIEQEAKLCTEDPHPDVFGINRDRSTVAILPKTLSFLTVTAQYAAKYGATFVEAVRRKHGEEDIFKFLRMDDPRHVVFKELEVAYQSMLCSTDEEVEDRLELYGNQDAFLRICEEKAKFVRGEIARKKAALLTDDELRRRLEWDAFTVVQTFSAKDLGLEKKASAAAAAPSSAVDAGRYLAPPNATQQTFMSSSFLRPSDNIGPQGSATAGNAANAEPPSASRFLQPPGVTGGVGDGASRFLQPPGATGGVGGSAPRFLQPPGATGGVGSAAPRFLQPPGAAVASTPRAGTSDPVVEDGYQFRSVDPTQQSGHAMEYFVDKTTGQRVHVSSLSEHSNAVVREVGADKKDAEQQGTVLAQDEEYELNIKRRVGAA